MDSTHITSFADPSIEQWIDEARKGSCEALGQLLEAFRRYLDLFAECGLDDALRPKIGSSDVVQDTFLEAQRDFAQFEGRDRKELLAWLRKLLLNNLLNEKRKFRGSQKRQISRELPWDIEQRHQAWATDSTPSQKVIRKEDVQRLKAAVDGLPDHYREVILLRNHEHLSFAEIGRRTGRSEDAARMLWARAFQRLARDLDA